MYGLKKRTVPHMFVAETFLEITISTTKGYLPLHTFSIIFNERTHFFLINILIILTPSFEMGTF